MQIDLRGEHNNQLEKLRSELKNNTQKITLKKKTTSNLFRYDGRKKEEGRVVDLSQFDKPLYLDEEEGTLEVQGSATYETIINFTFSRGFFPLVAPGFKHITIAGAIVGIGIESGCFKYGFAHDGLLEADVLLTDGKVVTCTPDNEHSDLFKALPNSYGTLGYILRVKIKLRKAKPYAVLTTKEYSNTQTLLDAIEAATHDSEIEYVESVVYSKDRLYVTTGIQVDAPPQRPLSIYGGTIFYKEISKPGIVVLKGDDYIFRYDPEWFWGIPETSLYKLFRLIAPKSIRTSAFYKRYHTWRVALGKKYPFMALKERPVEMFIQDWQVTWDKAKKLLDYALENVELQDGKPWLLDPIKTPGWSSIYPMKRDVLYFNLGSYSFAKKKPGKEKYHNTKIMDEFCFDLEGIKMLYSTSFMSEDQFNNIYNMDHFYELKEKYDSQNLLPTLYERAVKAY